MPLLGTRWHQNSSCGEISRRTSLQVVYSTEVSVGNRQFGRSEDEPVFMILSYTQGKKAKDMIANFAKNISVETCNEQSIRIIT